MSSCVPGPRSLRASGPRWAGLLALGAIILVLSSIPPAAAAEALNPARLAALTAAKASTARAARNRGSEAGPGLAGRHRGGKPGGKLRRPSLPPLLSIPVPAPGGGNGPGALAHRSERVQPHRPVQSQSVPRQVLIVLDEKEATDISNELARRHGLERKQSQRMELLNGRCELYELRAGRSLAQVMTALRRDPRLRLVEANFRYRAQAAADSAHAVLPQYALEKIALPQ